MKFSNLRLIKLLNLLYPPSATAIHTPGELVEQVSIVQRALPPSLFFERTDIQIFESIPPATTIATSSCPSGRFRWIHACDLITLVAAPLVDSLGFIQVRQTGTTGEAVTMAGGVFLAGSLVGRVTTHAILSGAAFNAGGVGGFIVPQGFEIVGNTVALAPTTVLRLIVMFTEGDIGEEFPAIS